MKTLKIFAYKGFIGTNTDIDGEGLLNNPRDPNQIGCVVRVANVAIDQEAKDIIKNCRREGGSFAPLMLTKTDESVVDKYGPASVAVVGVMTLLHSPEENVTIGRTCHMEVIDMIEVVDDLAPQDFKDFIEEEYFQGGTELEE